MPESPSLFFVVRGQLRECPAGLWESLIGPKPDDNRWECDGCTASPDFWFGIPLWVACRIHDWHYCDESPPTPRLLADLIFRVNLWRVARWHGAPRRRAAYVALIYWTGVSLGGALHYRSRKERLLGWLAARFGRVG